MSAANPFEPHLREQGHVVLDGGLATALEARGHDLNHALWSARVLLREPTEIEAVHRSYLDAGADCITTVSYQASVPGLERAGLDVAAAERLLVRSTELAIEARERYRTELPAEPEGNAPLELLVAASVGPYGAYLADGSEYVGKYDVDERTLDAFHRRRFGVLASSGPDLLACETIPSRLEAEVLLSILDDHPPTWAWLTFTCPDDAHISDGTRFERVVEMCSEHDRVAGVGVNCTAPEHVPALIARARAHASLPLIAYPNSGEVYDVGSRGWSDPHAGESARSIDRWIDQMKEARDAGASILGGCCRIGPSHIARLRDELASGD